MADSAAMPVRRVCLFGLPPQRLKLPGFQFETFDPQSYVSERPHFSMRDLVAGGLDAYDKRRALITAAGIDHLYRDRDPGYMRLVRDFVARFADFDLIVMATYNFLHPEVLTRELSRPVKVMGFVDDPHSSYVRGIPYLWAFDGGFYISPSYDDQALFADALRRWGCEHAHWWPLTQPAELPERDDGFFANRHRDVIYVGNPTLGKVDRLIELKRHLGAQLTVHGRWRAKGYYGLLRGLLGQPVYWGRVTPLSASAREALYFDTKIGFNMHVSDRPTEIGNMRMYETPAHGMMQLCDKAARNAHELIYVPDREAVFYDGIADAVDRIRYYLAHDDERLAIARAGYERVRRDYRWDDCLRRFLDWACALPRRHSS